MPDRAVIFHRPGRASLERQLGVCIRYAERRGYEVTAVVHDKLDAVKMLAKRLVQVIITATDGVDDEQLEADIRKSGGRLEYCRGRRRREQKSAADDQTRRVAVRLHELGESTDEIAKMLKLPMERIRRILHLPER